MKKYNVVVNKKGKTTIYKNRDAWNIIRLFEDSIGNPDFEILKVEEVSPT